MWWKENKTCAAKDLKMSINRSDRKEVLIRENVGKNRQGHKIDKVNHNENSINPKYQGTKSNKRRE